MSKHKGMDSYIAKSADFARPILEHFRALVYKACPDAEEKLKWGMPHFDYKGEMLCSMAAFKQHCAIGFWKASIMSDPKKIFGEKNGMGHLGQIKSIQDLPSEKILIQYIKEAMKLNDSGMKLPSREKTADVKKIKVPDYFTKALNKNKKALKTFENFSYSNKKDYVSWVAEAKTEETRKKRLDTAIEWMAEGKTRHWKYK